MEKYAKLLKSLEVCAGPECGIQCPYHGETRGGMTCRSRLLLDASIAINNEQALHESADEGLQNAVEELGKLTEERDNLRASLAVLAKERDNLRTERDCLRTKLAEMHHDKTDRPSVFSNEVLEKVGKLIAQAKYQEGRADAFEFVVGCIFCGEGLADE